MCNKELAVTFSFLTPLSFGHLPVGENSLNMICAKFKFSNAKRQSFFTISLYSKIFKLVPVCAIV